MIDLFIPMKYNWAELAEMLAKPIKCIFTTTIAINWHIAIAIDRVTAKGIQRLYIFRNSRVGHCNKDIQSNLVQIQSICLQPGGSSELSLDTNVCLGNKTSKKFYIR